MEKGSDRKDSKDSKTTLRITHQARIIGGGMSYALKCEGVSLTLMVTPRLKETDAGEWRIEARSKRNEHEDVVATEWGETRVDALRAVGRSWNWSLPTHGLSIFDWEDVARVLREVRAL
jgi:hypothetical protein